MDNQKMNRIYKVIMIVILTALVTSLVTSVVVYRYMTGNTDGDFFVIKTSKEQSNVSAIIDEFAKILDEKYLGEIDEQKLIDGAGKGLMDALGDPYSEYVPKRNLDSYTTTIMGNYYGVGMYIFGNSENGLIEVDSVIKKSPAAEAGILKGDFIVSIDGVKYTNEQTSEAAEALKGKKETDVNVEVLRGNKTLNFKLKRREVKINHVEGKKLENNVGYIQFSTFDSGFKTEFKDTYNQLKSEGIKSLIIDLRNNGGGLVSEALAITEYIVDKGSTIMVTVDKHGKEDIEMSKNKPIIDIPVIVLVNDKTASASEILAGAVQDLGKAKIVGTKTYGKGVIQQFITLDSGVGLKLTVEEYVTPNRNKIHNTGITPDVVVEMPKTAIIGGSDDAQLKKAIELLK